MPRLSLPAASDKKAWTSLNGKIQHAIKQVFPKRLFRKLTPSELVTKFDSWLYRFLADSCGLADQNVCKPKTAPKEWEHRGLRHLRKRKQAVRALFRSLKKKGLESSPEGLLLKERWLKLVREHNALRRAVNLKREAKREAPVLERRFERTL